MSVLSRALFSKAVAAATATTTTTIRRAKFHTLPKLPYEYDALEPVISKEIMELHHSKHHATYVNNLNKAMQDMKDAGDCAERQNELSTIIAFNSGGHVNHSMLWTSLSPPSKAKPEPCPTSHLHKALLRDFGSFAAFKEELSAKTLSIQGSGWGWLCLSKGRNGSVDGGHGGKLVCLTTANQESLVGPNYVPLLGIDVWEHAYYLQYKNKRADYIKAIFTIINWDDVSDRYAKAIL